MRRVLLLVALCSCQGQINGPTGGGAGAGMGSGGGGGSTGTGGGTVVEEPCIEPDGGMGPDDTLPPGRLLRRASFALRGAPPTDAELSAQAASADPRAYVDTFVDATLSSPVFYRTMFELARDWFNIPLVANDADAPEYGPKQQRVLERCPMTAANAGAYVYYRGNLNGCASGPTVQVEPWWAPGTTITLAGDAANTTNTGTEKNAGGTDVPITCDGRARGTCGCGANAVSCWVDPGTYPGWAPFASWNPNGQRRLVSEEPARLFAHLAWHDRPMTDLVLGTKSVGPTELQAASINQALAGGFTSVLTEDAWWRPSKFVGVPIDPEHTESEQTAWREFELPARNPVYLADRAYKFDPRSQSGAMLGVPAAGVLTTIGFLAAYPRERVRGARALETFACEVLAPPSSQAFNPYVRDPATEGPCQHCHKRIDPAAIHFKRFAKAGAAFEGWGAEYYLPGVGTKWHWVGFRAGMYPFHGDPFSHWNRWYAPDTQMTPVPAATVAANPESVFLDFLPPDQTLLGQTSDGTVGPLGFAKMIVASGAFDRCVVRHLHAQVLGRDIDPSLEIGYLELLTKRFVDGGRKVRPFVKSLTKSELFGRGL